MAGDVSFAISLQDNISQGAKSAAASLGQTENALKKAGQAGDSVAKKMAGGGKAAGQSGGAFQSLQGVVKGLNPAMGQAFEQATNLGKGLGGISGGAALAVVALVAVAAATVAAAAAFVRFGVSSADAAQHTKAMAISLTGSTQAGTQLAGQMERVGRITGVSGKDLEGFAKSLVKAKLSGAEMNAALGAAAVTSKMLGSEAADAFVKSATEAKKAGKSVVLLSQVARQQLGAGLALELNRPSVAAERLGASIAGLFDTSDVSGFGAVLNQISDALEHGAAVGDAFRAVFSALFGGLSADAQGAGGTITSLIEDMTVMFLKGAIAVKPMARSIGELWQKFNESGAARVVLGVVVGALASMAVVCILITAVVAAVAASITAMVVALGALIAAAFAVGYAIGTALAAALDAVISFVVEWSGLFADWIMGGKTSASDLLTGLVDGITGGAAKVYNAMKNLASGAIGAFKSMLGISSPSKVMLAFGGYTAEGFSGGLDQSAASVEASASSLAAIPAKAAAAADMTPAMAPNGSAGGAAGQGGGRSVTISGVTINITGVPSGEAILDKLPAALADAFDQIAESMGLGAVGV